MKPERRPTRIWFLAGRSRVRGQRRGAVGVVVPWNYPLYLAPAHVTPDRLLSRVRDGKKRSIRRNEAIGDQIAETGMRGGGIVPIAPQRGEHETGGSVRAYLRISSVTGRFRPDETAADAATKLRETVPEDIGYGDLTHPRAQGFPAAGSSGSVYLR
ncbi:MAG: hypothetical protein HXY20_15150 [Acidobacteria bacterium]|nr:hypothetical protein [Acidobacteriota bacterium]